MVEEEKNGDRVHRHSAMGKVGWVRGGLGRGEIGCRLKGNDSNRNHRGISAAPTSERVQLEESSVLFVPIPPTTRRGSPDTEQRQRFCIVPSYR